MPSFTSELRQRRVLPLLGAYLGGMWLLTELAGFAVERFGIDGRWAEGLFLAIWLLLPSALLVIWRVGPPGDATWHRHDRTAFLVNLLLAGTVLAWLAGRPSAPAAPVDEAAKAAAPAVERPARVAIFTRPAPGDTSEDALALLALTLADLDHDRRIQTFTAVSTPAIVMRLRRTGRTDPLSAPLGDLRLAALEVDADGFVVAQRIPVEGGHQLQAEFHALGPDRSLPALSVAAPDTWRAADALAAEIRARFAPASRAQEANDPDVRAVTTDSAEALAAYADGLHALITENDPARAAGLLRRAWEADPDFSLAGYAFASASSRLGRTQEARAALQRLLPRMDRLPERQRFAIQVQAQPDPARQRLIHEAWLRKFPEDREPRRALAWLDLADDPGDTAALATVRGMLLAEDSAVAFAQVAELHRRLGQYAEAEQVLRDGLARFPGEGPLVQRLAAVVARKGEVGEAQAMLEEWAQLRPDLITPWMELASLHFNHGRIGDADAALDQAEAQALNPSARLAVLNQRATLLLARGRTREALAMLPALLALQQAETQTSPLVYRHHLAYVGPYARVHGADAALAWVRDAMPADMEASNQAFTISLARMLAASAREDGEALMQAVPEFRQSLSTFGELNAHLQGLQADRYEADGLRLTGRPVQALARFRALEQAMGQARARGQAGEPNGASFFLPAIAAATAAGDLAQARAWLAAVEISEAADPNTQLARAALEHAAGNPAAARASLDQALATWAGADQDHPPLLRARRLAAQLGGSP
jgi:predicted Zn-dependent protease